MFKKDQIYGICAIGVILIITLLSFIPILILGLIKCIPYPKLQQKIMSIIDKMTQYWIFSINYYFKKMHSIQWDISNTAKLNKAHWHLVIANHQSWVDIFILQILLAKKIPILKFFIKNSLKWLPLFGFAWWAMGCPFMKRYSSSILEKRPHKQLKNMKTTRKALTFLKQRPVSIMNFVEGTRFSLKKKELQDSPFQYLLKPKSGGISYSVHSLAERIQSMLDITIVYPEKNISFWDFLCHRIKHLKVIVREIPIPAAFLKGDLLENEELKTQFRTWLNAQWAIKDELIAQENLKMQVES